MGLISRRKWLTFFFFILIAPSSPVRAQKIVSAGFFTGFAVPLTIDQGINADARYQTRYDLKWAPVGLLLAIDLDDYGIIANPGLVSIGQHFYVANSVGGQVGMRKIKMTYLQVPLGIKLRLIDLSFFHVSMTASVAPAFLLNGRETISHHVAKLTFPAEVEPALPPDYTVEYDGVIVPFLKDARITTKEDYKALQLFGALGLRSDWDVSEKTRVSFDLRCNVGFLDTRSDALIQKIKDHQAIYDKYGKRREMFISLTVGVSKLFEMEGKKGTKRKKNNVQIKRRIRR